MATRSSDVDVSAGYDANVVGFGWTNAVFLALLNQLSKQNRAEASPVASQQ